MRSDEIADDWVSKFEVHHLGIPRSQPYNEWRDARAQPIRRYPRADRAMSSNGGSHVPRIRYAVVEVGSEGTEDRKDTERGSQTRSHDHVRPPGRAGGPRHRRQAGRRKQGRGKGIRPRQVKKGEDRPVEVQT